MTITKVEALLKATNIEKERMLEIKQSQKELAADIRYFKDHRKFEKRKLLGMSQSNLDFKICMLSWKYRHWHIIYSILKGRTYSEIEQKVGDNNKPSMRHLTKYIEEL